MSIPNKKGNRHALHVLATETERKLHYAGETTETTADEMLGDIRRILSSALAGLAEVVATFEHDHDWESFSPARGEGDDQRCRVCGTWR